MTDNILLKDIFDRFFYIPDGKLYYNTIEIPTIITIKLNSVHFTYNLG